MGNDPIGSFRTHANYLRSLAMLANRADLRPDVTRMTMFAGRVTSLPAYTPLQPTTSANLAQVQKSLRNAWGSELLLTLGKQYVHDDEVVRLSNNWNVVMAYYATFHGTHSLLAAKGQPSPQDHATLQKQYVAFWTDRSINIAPFSLGVGVSGHINVPPNMTIDPTVHAWHACSIVNCASIACKALKSTRDEKLHDALKNARNLKRKARNKAWREDDEQRIATGKRPLKRTPEKGVTLTPQEKITVMAGQRSTSYLDYLYRLRIRSNYEDSTMFTDGPEDEFVSSTVRQDLAYLTATGLLLSELFITRMVGRTWMEHEARTWASANLPSGQVAGIAQRLPILFP